MPKSEFTFLDKVTWEIQAPKCQTIPLIFSSPHSGRDYPPEFIAASSLDLLQLRRSEDAFVDEIYASARSLGAPLLRALFPRAFVDANRPPYELDPEMFDCQLPDFVRTKSVRISAGLGTIPKIVAEGLQIRNDLMTFKEAKTRIDKCYYPYHDTLLRLINQTLAQFGTAVVIDCHSMPSNFTPNRRGQSLKNVDIVLGDLHGTSCHAAITKAALEGFTELGYNVTWNKPYAGGYITRCYGQPRKGVHALQIEINRNLYMDEQAIERAPGLPKLAHDISCLIRSISDTSNRVLMRHTSVKAAE
ncbi:MAG: hypothetical protein CBB68_12735 [Rhodospirillaceae bacterium TMED8]|nr:N-formylglutamate amidohydrolase [Magnetovibrio sp.]OUT48974.1 MAG: hypothetical protein CBB68_12735 [Rhodospirillaceae bacterium TMED8]